MLTQYTNYPTNINQQASQQNPSTQESCVDNNISHNVNYINPSPGHNNYYHSQMYSQLAMVQLYGNGWGGPNSPAHDNDNIQALSTTENNKIENN